MSGYDTFARTMTAEERERGWYILECGCHAHVMRAEVLKQLPVDCFQFCPKAGVGGVPLRFLVGEENCGEDGCDSPVHWDTRDIEIIVDKKKVTIHDILVVACDKNPDHFTVDMEELKRAKRVGTIKLKGGK